MAWLEGLVRRDDRGALAALRRGLGKPSGTAPEMHRYVVPWLDKPAAPWQDEPYYLVAALFADWHQGKAEPLPRADGNVGWSLREQATDSARTETGAIDQHPLDDAMEAIERRFVALLNSHPDDLAVHLRHAIGLLRARDVPVDWAALLHDIQRWDQEGRWVRRRWARAFWASQRPGEEVLQQAGGNAATEEETA